MITNMPSFKPFLLLIEKKKKVYFCAIMDLYFYACIFLLEI